MRYFVLLMALVLSSCSHDDSQVNNGWVIVAPLDRYLQPRIGTGFRHVVVGAEIEQAKTGILPPTTVLIFSNLLLIIS